VVRGLVDFGVKGMVNELVNGYGKSIRMFRLQKKVIKLITGIRKRKSCRLIFTKFKILTLASLYIFQFQFQFISHSIDPLQGQRPHGYRNSQDYNLLGPITNC
jgi:hypothetical protein